MNQEETFEEWFKSLSKPDLQYITADLFKEWLRLAFASGADKHLNYIADNYFLEEK